MTSLATSRSQDLHEDAAALTQHAIDLNRAVNAQDPGRIAQLLDQGRTIWASVARHSPDLKRPYSMRYQDQIDAALDAAETLADRARAPR